GQGASTAGVEVLDIDRKLATLRGTHPGMRAADVWYEAYRRRIANFDKRLGGSAQTPTFIGALRTFGFVIKDDLLRGARVRDLRRQLAKTVHGRNTRGVRRQAVMLSHRLALLE